MKLDELKEIFNGEQERYIGEWREFLSFKSISTDPLYEQECQQCADWVSSHLKRTGFSSKLLSTKGKPVVYGEFKGKPEKPVVLFYGHYDVQPVDPIDAWQSPPFEPEIRDGRMYARGAQDNKGQVMYFLKGVESLIRRKKLDCTVKVFIEGEEECGSEGISESMTEWEVLKGDLLMVCDTGMVPGGAPTITMGLRGVIFLTVRLSGASYDLHSGVHGGLAPNPAQAMARLLATLHNDDGSIAVKGFYDSVVMPDKEDRDLANSVPFDMEVYRSLTGVEALGGEKEYTFWERNGFRPTIEINGFSSGYAGPGNKTIIPSTASAKISSRIVAGQDPERCLHLIEEHLRTHVPEGLDLEISERGVGGPALSLSSKSKYIKLAKKSLDQLTLKETVFRWEGASIPVIPELSGVSGAEPLLVGFGTEEDRMHAPNESFSLEQFRLGFLYTGLFLSSL